MTSSERVMVFGAGGFLGARICALLADRGIEHRGMTLEHGQPHRRFDLAAGHCHALDAQVGMYKPTVIINAAGRRDGDAVALSRANVVAVEALLSALHRTANNARFVQLGSAAEYGEAPRGAGQDEQAELRPTEVYGFTKLAASELVLRAQRNGADAVVLRCFDLCGPGAPASTVLGRVVRELGAAEPDSSVSLELGTLERWRDFVDVRDVAEAVVAVAVAPDRLPPVLNVGSGQAALVRDIVQRLIEISGVAASVVEDEKPAREAGWQQADVSLIEKQVGWSCGIGLEQSLRDGWSARD